ncbi:hypothetical protein SAMN05192534_1592 [Alteribacillus persepolensis]|uniref:Lipoprotein n=1 Tax=Alteribacillus persepolensis TaxID=568899 RepID=A0A1G8KNG2_9BACI|nr:hypothetical protein [Alteribacillus persepolensis]SDI44974.1 hypothetical protein SAMN05192534_1592 [Alteribacillus persepolensis]
MRKLYRYLTILFIFLLASCNLEDVNSDTSKGKNNKSSKQVSEVTEDDFIYRLVSEKGQYEANEQVGIYAELEYVGDKDEIKIFHAASPFHFPMYEKTRGYEIGYIMEEPLLTTTITKGEPLREEYKGSGVYSAEDSEEYVNFIEAINDNQFLAGHYEVNGFADFYVQTNDSKREYKIKSQVEFKVKDNK